MTWAICQADSGRIVAAQFGRLEDAEINCMYPGEFVVETMGAPDTHWMVQDGNNPPEIVERPKILDREQYTFRADGEDGISITTVPEGTYYMLKDKTNRFNREYTEGTIDDGELEFKSTVDRLYYLTLEPPFPYQRQEIEITFNG